MSSFELLELFGVTVIDDHETKTQTIRVDFAPENGEVAKQLRGGERPEWQQMLAQSANELAVIRVVQAPDADSADYGSRLFLPMAALREYETEFEQHSSKLLNDAGDSLSQLWQED